MSITLTVVVPGHDPVTTTLDYEPNMTVARALDQAVRSVAANVTGLKYQEFPEIQSRFLREMNGLAHDEQARLSWALYVNGVPPKKAGTDDTLTGVDDTFLKDKDRVELRYEPF